MLTGKLDTSKVILYETNLRRQINEMTFNAVTSKLYVSRRSIEDLIADGDIVRWIVVETILKEQV